MNYAIIGSGNVGSALARQFARSGIAVSIANTRGADSLTSLTAELGPKVTASSLSDAIKADVIILAVPFRAHAAIGAEKPDWTGTTVIDAMNTYGIDPEELQGKASSDVVASAFKGAKVVKTLNQLPAKLLAKDPAENGGRRVMFVSSNDDAASASIAQLVESLGFATIALGRVDKGGLLLERGAPLVLQNLIKLG
jgi:8-hydroxy-5-deazaflavin:NADPH oxidoreductase